ncbi:hypothetical protein D3C79_714520 [compost metagenome]
MLLGTESPGPVFALVVTGNENVPGIGAEHFPGLCVRHAVQGMRLCGRMRGKPVMAAIETQLRITQAVGIRHQRIGTCPGPVQRIERLAVDGQQQVEPVRTQRGNTPPPGGQQAQAPDRITQSNRLHRTSGALSRHDNPLPLLMQRLH